MSRNNSKNKSEGIPKRICRKISEAICGEIPGRISRVTEEFVKDFFGEIS